MRSIDDGPPSDAAVDYPDFAALVAKKVSSGEVERGILICGTGIGMAIAANKFPGVRAAACQDDVTAELSRRHNDLNVLCLSGDLLSSRSIERVVEVWMKTEFEGGRHQRRSGKNPPTGRRQSLCVVLNVLGCGDSPSARNSALCLKRDGRSLLPKET